MVTCSKINERDVGLFGNKLFIVAALIGLAKRHNDEVILPGFQNWQYGHCFANPLKTMPVLPSINYLYTEPYFHYKEINYQPNMDIMGYFQSEKYFVDATEQVRSFFEPLSTIVETLKKRYPAIWNENCISIHVRRNDYLLYQDTHPACTTKYYMDAMDALPKADKYVIFSDDIAWCKNTFVSDNNDIIFVENQQNYEDMFLMSFCQNHIVANSSFSWWGAWLNKKPDKQVVMPKKWFGPAAPYDWKDIYPKGKVIIL